MAKNEKGFFILDKAWLLSNEFFRSLSHAEFRIMLYLLASVLRLDKRKRLMPKSMFLAYLYRDRNLLVASVTQRNIAKRCNVNRGTVQSALKKFEEMGAVMVLPCGDQGFVNNVYLLGFEAQNIMDIRSLYFVDSVYLVQGEPIPDGIRNFIMVSYLKGPEFQFAKSAKEGRYFFEHLFGVNPESKPAG